MTYDHVRVAIDGAIRDWETSGDAMRHIPEGQRWGRSGSRFLTIGRLSGPINVSFAASALGFGDSMRRIAEAMNRASTAVLRLRLTAEESGRLRRLGIFPEYNGPPPLCIDGREYHRRQQARRRRR